MPKVRIAVLIAIGATLLLCSPCPAHASTPPPSWTLVGTDTSEPYPFADLTAAGVTYHVTEGDILFGRRIRKIVPNAVYLTDGTMLTRTPKRITFARRLINPLAWSAAWARWASLRRQAP